jgi:chaperone BCS1
MEDSWNYVKEQNKRSLKTIFIEQEKKDILIKRLSNFIEKEKWYIENSIPYQLGILLYGPAGTGKTSLIKAIAGYLNYPIYYLSPQKLSHIETAMSSLGDKCIIVIEDIDSNFLTHSREKKDGKEIAPKSDNSLINEVMLVSLSEILNSLDCMFSAHGRILIATTNHVEKLDPALVRAGRIDLKLEIGFVNNEILKGFIDNFFPENKLNISEIKLKNNLTIATLQNLILEEKTIEEIVEFVKE